MTGAQDFRIGCEGHSIETTTGRRGFAGISTPSFWIQFSDNEFYTRRETLQGSAVFKLQFPSNN
ncbi:MAG: hypothetical protein WA322_23385 [Pseudolabrys sp.]